MSKSKLDFIAEDANNRAKQESAIHAKSSMGRPKFMPKCPQCGAPPEHQNPDIIAQTQNQNPSVSSK